VRQTERGSEERIWVMDGAMERNWKLGIGNQKANTYLEKTKPSIFEFQIGHRIGGKNFKVKGLLAINEGHLEGKIRLNGCKI